MLHVDRRKRLQYGNMAENSGAEKTSSPLREILRKDRVLWWTVDAVLTIALVGGIWLAHKRIPFWWLQHKWIHFPSDWFVPLSLGVGILLALALALALWIFPQWQVKGVRRLDAKERFDRVNEARKTLAQILGGTVLLAGFFLTWQNFNLAREGQITDRFTKAIEQLGALDAKGNNKLEVRLGGIYALERIANDSERDHWPIMEVLCTYVRVNAPIKRENPPSKGQKPKKPTQANQASTATPHPDADIQAILTVLGRRNRKYERENQVLDLRDTIFAGADLIRANLGNAELGGTDFRGAFLTGADFRGAFLTGADLSRAYLRGADLTGADLSGANLRLADVSGAHLDAAALRGADLSGAVLVLTLLVGADLSGADLSNANLGYAKLSGALLSKANLRQAFLSGANFDSADLSGADLSGADLSGADLRYASNPTQQQIDAAKGNSTTKLPANLHMPESWKK